MSKWQLHCWGNTTNGAFSFTSVESEEELINNTSCYTVRRNQLVIQAIKVRVLNKARPLLPGECMSLKGQQLGINCDCDSAEWQQLCNISGGRAGAGRGRHRESNGGREGGTEVNSVGFQGGLPILDTWEQPGTWRPRPGQRSPTLVQGRTRVINKGDRDCSGPEPETGLAIWDKPNKSDSRNVSIFIFRLSESCSLITIL